MRLTHTTAFGRIRVSKVFRGLLGKKLVNWLCFATHKECIDQVKIIVHIPELPCAHTKSEKKSTRVLKQRMGR